ncbi:REMORIN FAMILY PROTEIN [Salix koriyanagi]|uniref:REMORIN FAMILY PROTEIN n=1 Tax=Salix koriyanagi TaxID=2511006 RepID=A0A9Q0WUG0_9ROSI|nr:REMORIN FAMILY PROTEIN [Salix koriyanagi]
MSKNLRLSEQTFPQTMEHLLNQARRVRFSGQEKPEEPRSARERSSLKTVSFKDAAQNKGPQNWFRRQFSGQMNQDYDANRTGQATAVAAAAYAITSLNASSIPEQKKMSKGPETSLTQTDSKRDGLTDLISESGSTSKRFSGKGSIRSLRRQDSEPKVTVPKPELPPTSNPATPPTRRAKGDGTDADAWERDELSKIQRRYEKMKGTILSWENKKKEKAKKRIRKTESDLEKIRSTALKQFHDDMVDIGQIAGGARAKAEERQRNEEFKAKEKADTIRKTGKLPRTCFCF